jgi:hypothetical protein
MRSHFDLSVTACLRLHLGLTQQQLADSLGMSRSALAMAETGRRPMPEFAEPLLRQMMTVAIKMPIPQFNNWRHNRVHPSARLHTHTKKSFVTRQSSIAASYTAPALTRYGSGNSSRPSFSVQLLESQAHCQQLIDSLSVKKERLRYQLQYLHLEATIAVKRGKEISAQLTYVNTMIQSNLVIMEQFPTHKRKLEHRNAKLYCKKLLLEDRLEHFDAASMILREYTINVMVKQLEVLQHLIDSIENRKVDMQRQSALGVVKANAIHNSSAVDRGLLQQRA